MTAARAYWQNALLVLNLGLDVVDRVRRLRLERNRFTCESLDEDLHATTETKNWRMVSASLLKIPIKRTEVEGGLLLNIIIRNCASVLKLLASEE